VRGALPSAATIVKTASRPKNSPRVSQSGCVTSIVNVCGSPMRSTAVNDTTDSAFAPAMPGTSRKYDWRPVYVADVFECRVPWSVPAIRSPSMLVA